MVVLIGTKGGIDKTFYENFGAIETGKCSLPKEGRPDV